MSQYITIQNATILWIVTIYMCIAQPKWDFFGKINCHCVWKNSSVQRFSAVLH